VIFVAFFVRRPAVAALLLVITVLSDLLARPLLPVPDLPDVNVVFISVSAFTAGGTSGDVARIITYLASSNNRMTGISGDAEPGRVVITDSDRRLPPGEAGAVNTASAVFVLVR